MRLTPRTRWLLVTGAAATCIAAAATGAVAANAGDRPARTSASAPAELRPNPPKIDFTAVGDVVPAGFGGWSFWAQKVDSAELPKVRFGVMAGKRTGDGLTGVVMSNETEGSDRAPGFHAVQTGMNVGGSDTPTFGYYAGPAAKITAKGGVTAKQAVWSEDSTVVFFWFDPAQVGAGFSPEDLAAFDAAGRKLPTGNNGPAVG